MKKIKLTQLKKAGKELNALLFDDDNPQIEIKASEEELSAQILQAVNECLDPDDEVSKATQEVIDALQENASEEPAEEASEEPAEEVDMDELAQEIMDCEDVKDLRKMCKEYVELESCRKGIGIKKIEKLRNEMLEALGYEVEDSTKEAPKGTDKKEKGTGNKKEKGAKKEKKEGAGTTEYGHRKGSQSGQIDEVLLGAKKALSLDEIAEEVGCTAGRVKNHIAHLEKNKDVEFKLVNDKYRIVK